MCRYEVRLASEVYEKDSSGSGGKERRERGLWSRIKLMRASTICVGLSFNLST